MAMTPTSPEPEALPRLTVHIGAGKTGSTSIQFTLQRNREALTAQGTAYLGLMLEEVPGLAGQHDWCVAGRPQAYFQAPDPARADDEVVAAVLDTLRRLGADGIREAVWSNEAFLTRAGRIVAILERLQAAGVRLRILCYLRRHDGWAKSAYVQFGIRFKTYTGPLRPFADWAAAQDLTFARHLRTWDRLFPGAVEVFNYDALPDVVEHFMATIGVTGLAAVAGNRTPPPPVLAAWAVFNGQREQRVMPHEFQALARPLGIVESSRREVPPLGALLPSEDDLARVRDDCREDLEALNTRLAQAGQPRLGDGAPPRPGSAPDGWGMDHLLLEMVFSLQAQVSRLEQEMARLRDGA